jgi:hypothetical protein
MPTRSPDLQDLHTSSTITIKWEERGRPGTAMAGRSWIAGRRWNTMADKEVEVDGEQNLEQDVDGVQEVNHRVAASG